MGGMSSKASETPKSPTLNDDHSINWKTWKEILADPRFPWMTYDPPQKHASYGGRFKNLYFFQPRACIGSYPPCCIAQCIQAKQGFRKINISKPDEWMPQFLERENEDLPESWRGIWWLEDNTANETLVSMQDMWKTEALAGKELFFKDQATNWTAGTSLWGTLLRKMSKVKVPFELEPGENPKWLGMLTGDDYIYFLDEEDKGKLVYPDGKPVDFVPGLTWLRVSCMHGDVSKGVAYQYLMRKIAFKDPDGNIVKTQYYDKLLERCERPTPEGCCCNLFLCNMDDAHFAASYEALDDHQLVVFDQDKYPIGKPPHHPEHESILNHLQDDPELEWLSR